MSILFCGRGLLFRGWPTLAARWGPGPEDENKAESM